MSQDKNKRSHPRNVQLNIATMFSQARIPSGAKRAQVLSQTHKKGEEGKNLLLASDSDDAHTKQTKGKKRSGGLKLKGHPPGKRSKVDCDAAKNDDCIIISDDDSDLDVPVKVSISLIPVAECWATISHSSKSRGKS